MPRVKICGKKRATPRTCIDNFTVKTVSLSNSDNCSSDSGDSNEQLKKDNKKWKDEWICTENHSKEVEMSACSFCEAKICTDGGCDYDDRWARKCADCCREFCNDCAGESCGYCSDPVEWKKYYCKDHEESRCGECNNILCHYCLEGTIHSIELCEWCDVLFHNYCMKKHYCYKAPKCGFCEDNFEDKDNKLTCWTCGQQYHLAILGYNTSSCLDGHTKEGYYVNGKEHSCSGGCYNCESYLNKNDTDNYRKCKKCEGEFHNSGDCFIEHDCGDNGMYSSESDEPEPEKITAKEIANDIIVQTFSKFEQKNNLPNKHRIFTHKYSNGSDSSSEDVDWLK